MTIATILVDAFRSLVSSLNAPAPECPRWYGRERELVNLYVFSHLCERLDAGSPLFDRGQISIEVAVKQALG